MTLRLTILRSDACLAILWLISNILVSDVHNNVRSRRHSNVMHIFYTSFICKKKTSRGRARVNSIVPLHVGLCLVVACPTRSSARIDTSIDVPDYDDQACEFPPGDARDKRTRSYKDAFGSGAQPSWTTIHDPTLLSESGQFSVFSGEQWSMARGKRRTDLRPCLVKTVRLSGFEVNRPYTHALWTQQTFNRCDRYRQQLKT